MHAKYATKYFTVTVLYEIIFCIFAQRLLHFEYANECASFKNKPLLRNFESHFFIQNFRINKVKIKIAGNEAKINQVEYFEQIF